MTTLLGCNITPDLFDAWSRIFVFEQEPIYLTDEARPLLSADSFSRKELRSRTPDGLDFADAYRTYLVSREAPWVALMAPAQLDEMPPGARAKLMQLQWRLGRGQIYDRAFVIEALGCVPAALEPHALETPNGVKIALRHDAWWAFSAKQRQRWVSLFVTRNGGPADHIFVPDGWAGYSPTVRQLAGTCAALSGPNCFGTALAAATGDLAVADQWIVQEQFLAGLAAAGYVRQGAGAAKAAEAPAGTATGAGLAPGCVLVWSDSTGLAQHAAFVLGDDLVLNKQSQSWWSPRQVVPMQALLDSWEPEGFAVSVYTK